MYSKFGPKGRAGWQRLVSTRAARLLLISMGSLALLTYVWVVFVLHPARVADAAVTQGGADSGGARIGRLRLNTGGATGHDLSVSGQAASQSSRSLGATGAQASSSGSSSSGASSGSSSGAATGGLGHLNVGYGRGLGAGLQHRGVGSAGGGVGSSASSGAVLTTSNQHLLFQTPSHPTKPQKTAAAKASSPPPPPPDEDDVPEGPHPMRHYPYQDAKYRIWSLPKEDVSPRCRASGICDGKYDCGADGMGCITDALKRKMKVRDAAAWTWKGYRCVCGTNGCGLGGVKASFAGVLGRCWQYIRARGITRWYGCGCGATTQGQEGMGAGPREPVPPQQLKALQPTSGLEAGSGCGAAPARSQRPPARAPTTAAARLSAHRPHTSHAPRRGCCSRRQYAWGHDELNAGSRNSREWFNMGLTIVDSLDTLQVGAELELGSHRSGWCWCW